MKFHNYLIVILISSLISFASYVLLDEGYVRAPEMLRKSAPVPNLSGQSPELAGLIVASGKFRLNVAGQEFTSVGEKGKIFRQSPAPGFLLKSGRTIDAWVSAGAFSIAVPDLKALSSGEAKDALRKVSLNFGTPQKESSGDIAENKVIRTIPGAGAWCERGAEVTLVLSSGAELTTVPNLKGKTLAATRNILKAKNLTLGMVKKETNINQRFDIILRQYPNPGTRVKEGTAVTVVLNVEDE